VSQGSRVFPYAKSYPLDPPHTSALLFHSHDEEVRRLVYTRGNSSPANNLIRIENLIYLRHSLATLTGFDSFAAYSIQPYSLAQTPEAVTAFLHEMATELRPLVRQVG
jgi:Zn-dependent oligopeptidase